MNPLSYLNDEGVMALFKELQLDDATPAEKQEFLADLSENLIGEVMLQTLEKLPESSHSAYADLMEKGDIEGVIALVAPHIPDFNTHVKDIVDGVIAELKMQI